MVKMLVMIVMAVILTACSNNTTEGKTPEGMPEDFAFSLKYGITAANELNTYEGTYTKDLVEDGTATTDFVLTDEELKSIYEKFRNADVLALPEEEGRSPCVSPYNQYKLTMTADGEDYQLNWDTSCETRALNKWENVMDEINKDIIFPNEAYQSLPAAVGGYD